MEKKSVGKLEMTKHRMEDEELMNSREMKTESTAITTGNSKGRLWTARIMSGMVILFMLFDGISKLAQPKQVVESTLALGFGEHHIALIGMLNIICTMLYLMPRAHPGRDSAFRLLGRSGGGTVKTG